jgi:hypothetical protein
MPVSPRFDAAPAASYTPPAVFTVLLRSQPDVQLRLFERVDSSPRPLLVAQERELAQGGSFERRLPYRYLLEHRAALDFVLVADDGNLGLWRDPVGELAAREFSGHEDIAAATSGFLIYREGLDPTYLKRDLWDPQNDVRAIIERLRLDIPVPPRPQPQAERPRFRRIPLADDDAEDTDPLQPVPTEPDPFEVLGLPRSASEEQVKQAFRALVVQYHPDKVAHLAPEFQELADEKTRLLTAAYQAIRRLLDGEPEGQG